MWREDRIWRTSSGGERSGEGGVDDECWDEIELVLVSMRVDGKVCGCTVVQMLM